MTFMFPTTLNGVSTADWMNRMHLDRTGGVTGRKPNAPKP